LERRDIHYSQTASFASSHKELQTGKAAGSTRYFLSKARMSLRCKIELNFLSLLIAMIVILAMPAALAQRAHAAQDPSAVTATLELPDSPGSLLFSSSSAASFPESQASSSQGDQSVVSSLARKLNLISDEERAQYPASTLDKNIAPNQSAPHLTAMDKVALGLTRGVSPFSVTGWFISAGFSHGIDSAPNYGVDKGAFGERLGAAALRGYSEEVFSDALLANLLHQDPRYYKLGPTHTIMQRGFYAASSVLITRRDDGSSAPNYSLIGGNLMGAALTNAYYPEANRSFGQTATTFGGAMGGAAFSYVANEFLSDLLKLAHLTKAPN
jgi:hypothetical protein